MAITINGSGTVTGISAGGLPDGVITTDDIAAGAVTTAKITGGPAFGAYPSTATTTATATFTKVTLGTEEFDTASCFDTANSRFTPNVAGYYQINGAVSDATASTAVLCTIYKNGTEFKRGTFITTAACTGAVVSSLIYLNGSTDYVELYWYQTSGVSHNTNTAQSLTYFNGYLARPA